MSTYDLTYNLNYSTSLSKIMGIISYINRLFITITYLLYTLINNNFYKPITNLYLLFKKHCRFLRADAWYLTLQINSHPKINSIVDN